MTELQKREKEHFEKLADLYDQIYRYDRPTGQARIKRRAQMMAEACALNEGARVLELGCGTAVLTEHLERLNLRLVAMDLSQPMILAGQERRGVSKTSFVAGDIMVLPFSDGSFEAVVGTSILHHLDFKTALKEVYRVLKPGARIAFSEPNHMNPHVFFERSAPVIRRKMHVSPDETAFFRWRLKRAVREAGFVNVGVTPFDFLAPYVPTPLKGVVSRAGRVLEHLPLIKELSGSLFIIGERPA